VLVFGLGAGGVLSWVLHQMHPVFFDAKTLREMTHRPVLGVVSLTWLERKQVQRRLNFLSFATASAALVLVCAVLILFNEQLVGLIASFRDLSA
jgi:hypothetical protein